jgi:trimeric autotransporter adhesin
MLKPILYGLAAACAAVLITTTSALAGSGPGDTFNLGQVNTVDQKSTLTGATPEAELLVQNTGTGTALNLMGGAGAPAFKVNSTTKIVSLNADLLDGLDSAALQKRVTGTCAAGQAIRVINANGTVSCQAVGGAGGSWSLSGNAGTTPGPNFLGTSDDKALELKVNGQRALRLEPDATSPNLIGGFAGNSAAPGFHGVTIAGGGLSGFENVGGANFATVGGGHGNTASGIESTVAGGLSNTASGIESTVAGGHDNTASAFGSTVGGGEFNTASGAESTAAGGLLSTASGTLSFAAGLRAQATQQGSFVWGDGSTSAFISSPAANTVTVRAAGGIWLGTTSTPLIFAGHFIDTSTGGYLSSAGVWTDASDRALKHDFRPLSTKGVLAKVARMPIESWSYKAESPSVRHIGPTAQDFYSAFGLGLDDKHIGTIDEGGVALAAIKGLYRQNLVLQQDNQALNAKVGRIQRENGAVRGQLKAQNARLARLERAVFAR